MLSFRRYRPSHAAATTAEHRYDGWTTAVPPSTGFRDENGDPPDRYVRPDGFQRDPLYAIAGRDGPHGLAIEEELESYYEAEVHRGRLYPPSTRSSIRGSSRRDDSTGGRTSTLSPVGGVARSGAGASAKTATSTPDRTRRDLPSTGAPDVGER